MKIRLVGLKRGKAAWSKLIPLEKKKLSDYLGTRILFTLKRGDKNHLFAADKGHTAEDIFKALDSSIILKFVEFKELRAISIDDIKWVSLHL